MRRIGTRAHIASLLAVFALLLAACGGGGGGTTGSGTPSSNKPVVQAALVTDIGGLNDGGFNQLSHEGYEKARTQYGFKDEVIQTKSQNDYITNLTTAAKEADLVIAVGFLMQVPLDKIAKQFPNKKFAIVDGCATATVGGNCDPLSNVAQLFFKEQEAGCLVGAIAGQMEMDGKSKVAKLLGKNTIGAVGGLPIPPVQRYIAGYKFCAKKVDPKINVVISYSNDFVDATKCKAAALSQISDKQADIIFQVAGQCGLGVLDAANQKNVYSIGVDADQSKDSSGAARPSVITSALKRVDTAVYTIINDAQSGSYDGFVKNPTKFDLIHDGVGYATPSSDVPSDAQSTANTYAAQIKSSSLTPPEAIP